MKPIPAQFWIVLPLSKDMNQSLRFERFETLDAAKAEASDLAATRPTPEGYAVMECVLVSEEPVVTVKLSPPEESPEQQKIDAAAETAALAVDPSPLTPAKE